MNIYIIGPSHSGKTPIANLVAEALKYKRISASDWVRRIFTTETETESIEGKQKVLEEITFFSQKMLKENPNRCIEYIQMTYPHLNEGGYVLEGFRNPKDFLTFFNPAQDLLVNLHSSNLKSPVFEMSGLSVIQQSVHWFIDCELMKHSSNIKFTIKGFYEIEPIAKEIVSWVQTNVSSCES